MEVVSVNTYFSPLGAEKNIDTIPQTIAKRLVHAF
jgi:hypothetical protein